MQKAEFGRALPTLLNQSTLVSWKATSGFALLELNAALCIDRINYPLLAEKQTVANALVLQQQICV